MLTSVYKHLDRIVFRLAASMVPGDVVVPVAYMGAPTIVIERMASGIEPIYCLQALRHLYTAGGYQDGKIRGGKRFLSLYSLYF